MRAALREKIELVKHLYPKCQYPTDSHAWTIGHTCLQQIEELMVPRDKMFMPSWIDHILLEWLHGKNCPPFQVFKKVYDAFISELSYVKECRDEWEQHPMERHWVNIKNKGLWNCEECSFVAHQWLNVRQMPHQMVDLRVCNKETKETYDAHCFIAFSKENPSVCRHFEDTLKHLPIDEDMYILDVWLGRCAPAQELLHTYANMLKYQKNNTQQIAPIAPADDIEFCMSDGIQRMSNWTQHCYFEHIKPILPGYVMGHCSERGDTRFFVPAPQLQHHQTRTAPKTFNQNTR